MMAHKNGTNQPSTQTKIHQSQELMTQLANLSKMLNTGLTEEQLNICVQLCEAGVNPQALAEIVKQIRTQVDELKKEKDG